MRTTRLLTELRCAHWNQTETGNSGSTQGWLVAGSVTNTNDRDAPALEVRAGMLGVGRTFRDAAGLSSTNRNRVKVSRRPQWRVVWDPSVLRQRLRFGYCCSDSQKMQRKLPGNATREQNPGNTSSQCAHPHPPCRGRGDSTQTGLLEYRPGRPLRQNAGRKIKKPTSLRSL